MRERRKEPRLVEENEATIKIISDGKVLPKEKITSSYSMDISVHGTKIQTNVLLPVNTILSVDFSLKTLQQKINAIGKVKWIKVIIANESYEAGVEFLCPSMKLAEYIVGKQNYQYLKKF
jgi:hypothetical protein